MEKKKITRAGLFKAPFVYRLQSTLNDALAFFRRKFGINSTVRITDGSVCCTNGETITIGSRFSVFQEKSKFIKNAKDVVAAIYGVTFHEIGHLLYTPFNAIAYTRLQVYDGSFYPKMPDNATTELVDFMSKGEKERARVYTLYEEIDNILEDGRIENWLLNGPCGKYKNFASGLRLVRSCFWESHDDLDELLAKAEDIKASGDENTMHRFDYEMLYELSLQIVRYGQIKGCRKEHHKIPIIKDLIRLSPAVSTALSSETVEEYYESLNEYFCGMFKYALPYLQNINEKDEELSSDSSSENSQSGESGSGSPKKSSAAADPLNALKERFGVSQNQGASDKTERIEAATQKAKEDLKKNAAQQGSAGDPGSGEGKSKQGSSFESRDRDDFASNPLAGQTFHTKEDKEATANIDLDKINSVVTDEDIKAEKQQARKEELAPSGSYGDIHSCVSWHINSIPDGKDEYAEVMYAKFDDFVEMAQDAAERLRELIQVAPETYYDQGHFFGQRLNQNRFFDPSMKYFDRKINIPGAPTLSVSILVDQSGSMGGKKIEWVKAMTIALFEMCRILGIPYAVFGHNASCAQVFIDNYCYFGDTDEETKYKLLKIDSNRCNRDGAALRYVAEKTAQQNTDRKLLFVISDGQPNDDGYGGKIAEDDIRDAVAEYGRQGVSIIAAAIDQDKEKIEHFYGSNRFLDISSLEDLPSTIAEIVQRNIS